MKNSSLKGALGALAVVGVAFAAKKMSERRKFMKGIFEEYDIKEKTPFGFADKIRELDDEKYAELKINSEPDLLLNVAQKMPAKQKKLKLKKTFPIN